MRYIRIHKEGRLILGSLLLILLLMNLLYTLNSNWWFGYKHCCFCLYFFSLPISFAILYAGLLSTTPVWWFAPADGTIVVVEPVEENEYFGDKRIQVSIFMSVFNVHANWVPVRGLLSNQFTTMDMAAFTKIKHRKRTLNRCDWDRV